MMILLHILIALASVGYSTVVFFTPSQRGLQVSYVLVTLTIFSGTYLAILHPSHLLEVCTLGLLYTGVVTASIIAARHKLATVKNRIKNNT